MKSIGSVQQFVDDEDIQAVVDVLKSDFLTCGPTVEKLERTLAEYTGAKYAVAVSNATVGLHLATRALQLTSDDILWTSPNTFVASANCGLYCGAKVDFVDIDLKTYNMSIAELEIKLKEAKEKNRLPKVVIPVHFAGESCEMAEIYQLSREYGFHIIEDASHAIGASYRNQKVGNCTYSDFTIFSLHPVKIVTAAEGGIVLTNNQVLYEKVKLLRSHGMVRNSNLESDENGSWFYQVNELGYNYRITELQSALVLSQLKKIDLFIKKRQKIAQHYDESLHDLPIVLPYRDSKNYSALHFYPIWLKESNKSRKQIFQELQTKGIAVNVHYIPVHTQPLYTNLGFKENDFPNAVKYYKKAISLPIYYALTNEEQDYIIKSLYETLL